MRNILTHIAEFYSVYDGDYDDAWEDYMIYGGLPQVVGFQSADEIGILVDVGVVEIIHKDNEGRRVRKQLEVDFVVNQGNQLYPGCL